MDIREIRDFLNLQLDFMEHSRNEEVGLTILLMIDYLLEHVQKQPDVFIQSDISQVRKAFLKCGSSIDRFKNIYNQYSPSLLHTAVRILEKIQENIKAIEEKKEEIRKLNVSIDDLEKKEKELREQEEEVLKREKELQDLQKQYVKLQELIKKYKEIIDEITPERLAQMEARKNELSKTAREKKEEKIRLDKEINQLNIDIDSFNTLIENLKEQKAQNEITSITNETKVKELKKDVEMLQKRNKEYEKNVSRLSEEIVKSNEEYQELKSYFVENEKLEKSIEKEGFFDKKSFIERLEQVKKQGRESLEIYNKLLSNIMKDATSLYEKIKARQRKK